MSAQFPAVVVDVGEGADFTIFKIFGGGSDDKRIAQSKAEAYAEKYLVAAQPPIAHRIYLVNSQEDFDAILAKNRRLEIQAKIWRLENELAQAKKELKEASL